jgi:cystathionine beta-lyase
MSAVTSADEPAPASPVDYDRLGEAELRARRTHKWHAFAPDVLPMELAELDVPTAPCVVEAIRRAVDVECFGYPMFADRALAEATASFCARRYGWAADPGWVHDVPDVLRGVEIALAELGGHGDVVLPTPSYPPFFDVIGLAGRRAVEVPMLHAGGRARLDLDRIDDALAAGAGAVLLCNPQNPTGRAFTPEELAGLSDVVDRRGARVVADEVHGPLTYGRRHVPYASVDDAAAAHSVTVLAASKAWNLAGLKCAQVVMTNAADERRWREIGRFRTLGASTIGIAASIAAYEEGEVWLDGLLGHLASNRDLLARRVTAEIPGARMVAPEATYLAWIDFGDAGLPQEPSEHFLAQARVALRAGRDFGAGFDQWARLNFGTTTALLERGISAIAAAVPGGIITTG